MVKYNRVLLCVGTNVNIIPKYYRRVHTHRSTTWHAANT